MSAPVVQLTANDFEEAIDFLNLVFSASWRPHDFVNLLPALYRPTDEHLGHNFAIRQSGRIRAIVGMFPLQWQVGGSTLRLAGIGGVSTHSGCRGAGFMQTLMRHCVERMRAEKYHLSWLGGQRQRYLHYGYETAGTAVAITLNKRNLRATADRAPKLRFAPLKATDRRLLARAQALHDAQPLHAVRPAADFHLYLRTWHHEPHAAFDAKGRLVGYLVTNKSGDYVAEFAARHDNDAFNLLQAWVLQRDGDGVNFDLSPLPSALLHRVTQCCEHVQLRSASNWQVFDWAATLDALLKARHTAAPLPKGAVVVGVKGQGRFRLEVAGTAARCRTTAARADVEADAPTVTRLLFGPLKPAQVLPLGGRAAVLEAWCPLPARWGGQDGV